MPVRLFGVATLLAICGAGWAEDRSSRVPLKVPAKAAPKSPLKALEKRYSIRVVVCPRRFQLRWGPIRVRGDVPRSAKLDSYAPILLREFGSYPVSFVRKSKLWAIYLCRDLHVGIQARTAIPDYARNILYLDVERGRKHPHYVRKVIHHEFFHMVDRRDDGRLRVDTGWAALNPKGFRYGRGGRSMQNDPQSSVPDPNLRGFLNRYSTSALAEDKAEVFAHLMVQPGLLEARAATDPVLRRKTAYLKRLLAAFSPEMNAGYWARRKAAAR